MPPAVMAIHSFNRGLPIPAAEIARRASRLGLGSLCGLTMTASRSTGERFSAVRQGTAVTHYVRSTVRLYG